MSDHDSFSASAGVAASRTSLVWVQGTDAVSFLEGLLSQNIAAILPGEGAPSLLLAPNGKLRAILRVVRTEDRIGLLCDAAVENAVAEDLKRFKIRVKVEIELETADVWDVWGPEAAAIVGYDGSGLQVGENCAVAGYPLQRSDLPRYVVVGDRPDAPKIPPDVIESIRIAHGEPVAGVDLDDKVIPQEALDVSAAVDFAKGCYLGQELVARIDSRGHVNRRLAGFTFPGSSEPLAGSEVTLGDRAVGRLTSVGRSSGGAIGLGMLRTEVGDATEIAAGEAPGRVCPLPMTEQFLWLR